MSERPTPGAGAPSWVRPPAAAEPMSAGHAPGEGHYGTAAALFAVWYRHARVYSRMLIANAMPPVLEPLFFFIAIAVGLAVYMNHAEFVRMTGLSYTTYVASGIVITSAMFTGVFETTYSTFVRLTWQKTYDAMLSTHLSVNEVFIGELIFCGTKGGAFALIVMLVTALFGVQMSWWCLLVPVVGFVTGYLFGAIGLIITSYVKTINNFTFFTTGVVTPMFFFSGTFFPIHGRHAALDAVWLASPLTHSVELSRALYRGDAGLFLLVHIGLIAAWVMVTHWFAMRRMARRVLG